MNKTYHWVRDVDHFVILRGTDPQARIHVSKTNFIILDKIVALMNIAFVHGMNHRINIQNKANEKISLPDGAYDGMFHG